MNYLLIHRDLFVLFKIFVGVSSLCEMVSCSVMAHAWPFENRDFHILDNFL